MSKDKGFALGQVVLALVLISGMLYIGYLVINFLAKVLL